MGIFSRNKDTDVNDTNTPTSSPTERTKKNELNGIPMDGGFGHKNLAKFENVEGTKGARHNSGDYYANDTDNLEDRRDPNINFNNDSTGRNYDDGQTSGAYPAGRYEEPADYQNPGSGRAAGGGGFISDAHAQQLYRDSENRRAEQRQMRGGAGVGAGAGMNTNKSLPPVNTSSAYANQGNSNSAGYPSFDPNTNTNANSNYSNQYMTQTSPSTGRKYGTSGVGGSVGSSEPHNSQSLKTKAESKMRESEAMQKQAAEIARAEELEREALRYRSNAVDAGAHPLHGHQGGITGRTSQA